MKNYLITEQQINAVLQVLGEVPAKLSFQAIVTLQQLTPIGAPVSPLGASAPEGGASPSLSAENAEEWPDGAAAS